MKDTTQPPNLEKVLAEFLRELQGINTSEHTITAYTSDLTQFMQWLHATNLLVKHPGDVRKLDISEYLSYLGQKRISGLSRARKLAAIRRYFKFCLTHEYITESPAQAIDTPKREKNIRAHLTSSECNQLRLAVAGNLRDMAIVEVFLQCALRVSEVCNLRLSDIDYAGHLLHIRQGKGKVDREIPLVKKAAVAIQNYLRARPQTAPDHLFLNRYGQPIGERGLKKLVTKYLRRAGITKRAGCHSLRHTSATIRAEQGMPLLDVQELLGHKNLSTTQRYLHVRGQNRYQVMEATSL